MDRSSKWIFTNEQILNAPSRKYKIDFDKETRYRQYCTKFIYELGQSLRLTELCRNTAIVYMHRFYMFHSMTKFDKYKMGIACLYLSAKTEEMAQRIDTVIHQAHKFLYRKDGILTSTSERYLKMYDELIFNENILLMTLGFDVQVHHPHPIILNGCELIKADKELKATSYILASNSLHLTTMCLQYRPSVVACLCIYIAAKWASYNIPLSSLGKPWFTYIDGGVTFEILDKLTDEFLHIVDTCQTKLKRVAQTNLACLESSLHQKLKHIQNHKHQTQSKTKAKIKEEPQLFNEIKSDKKLIPPALTLSIPKSIFSPSCSFSEKFNALDKQPPKLLPQNIQTVTFNNPENLPPFLGSPQLENNPLKRRLSGDENHSQKRLCISNNAEQSTKMSNDISIILMTSYTTESLKPIDTISNSILPVVSDSSEIKEKIPVNNQQVSTNILENISGSISTTVDSEKEMEIIVNVTDIPENTVNESQVLRNIIKESKSDEKKEERKKKQKSKKSKKQKKEKKEKKKKKDKKRKKEKRKHKVQDCDKKTNNLKMNPPMTPIKISIPKERLNLSDNLIFSGSKPKSSQESILKIKIPKKMILDTESDSPSISDSVQASLSLQISSEIHKRNVNEMTWMTQQRMQPVFNGY